MKAKNISGRLARFLAVLMAMVLIASCTAIPVALAEEAEVPTETVSIALDGFIDDADPLYFVILNALREKCPYKFNVTNFDGLMAESSGEGLSSIAVLFDEYGSFFYDFETIFVPDVLVLFDACKPLNGGAPSDASSQMWAYKLLNQAARGKYILVYVSNSDSDCAQQTRLIFEVISSIVDGNHADWEYIVIPVEGQDGVYSVQLAEGSVAGLDDVVGYITLKSLDLSPEETAPVVASDLAAVLYPESVEVSEDDAAEVTANE